MVEVSQNIPLTPDEPRLSNSSCTMYENTCRSNLEEINFLNARRIAAFKRTMMKTKSRKLSSDVTSVSPSTPPFPGSPMADIKRLRPALFSPPAPVCKAPPVYRIRNLSAPLPSVNSSAPHTKIICQAALLRKSRLLNYLQQETQYLLNPDFLFHVNPVTEDKVNANMRNEAMHNLRFMHNAFFTLSPETFCKAVSLIDRFIVKVKVKPKYISCVATAAYHMAAKLCESKSELGIPNPETLVQISRCGGNADDLFRMENIIASKLNNDLNGITALEFLRVFAASAIVLPDFRRSEADRVDVDGDDSEVNASDELDENDEVFLSEAKTEELLCNNFSSDAFPNSLPNDFTTDAALQRPRNRRWLDFWNGVTARLIVALCSLEVYRFTYATLALGILLHFGVSGVPAMARICNIPIVDVQKCNDLVGQLYDTHYLEAHPNGRRALVWTLSRRTLLRIGYSSPTPLDTISEDCETDKETNLQFLFEP